MKIREDDEFETLHCGRLKVIKYQHSTRVTVRFLDTGYTTCVQASQIRSGCVKDSLKPSVCGVGFIGDGVNKSYHLVGGKMKLTPTYQLWSNILKRCYCESKLEKHPTYRGCSVDPRWHNYQNFCEDIKSLEGFELWSLSQDIKYELDKDCKVAGNKIYSKDLCKFITKQNNIKESFTRRF